MSEESTTVEFIESKGKWGMKLGLDNIKRLLDKLSNPQNDLNFIHIAGSNGKGSVSRILESILTEQGYNIGLYTSPALEIFNERIRFNRENIPDSTLNRLFRQIKEKCEELEKEGYPYPTGFEIETALALLYFKELKADICIMEVGLGGRLDATNVIPNKEIAIITPISLEHTKYLGNTLGKIAGEKAAIITEDCDVITAPQDEEALQAILLNTEQRKARSVTQVQKEEIKSFTESLDGQIIKLPFNHYEEEFETPLLGDFQRVNILTALKAVESLKKRGYPVQTSAVRSGLKNVRFPGRFELLNRKPYIIIDGAHNSDGISHFVYNIKNFFNNEKINLFFGMIEEKDVETCLEMLLPVTKHLYLLAPNSPDALNPNQLEKVAKEINPDIPVTVLKNYENISKIIDLNNPDNIYAFTGSLYLIGEIRSLLIKKILPQQDC